MFTIVFVCKTCCLIVRSFNFTAPEPTSYVGHKCARKLGAIQHLPDVFHKFYWPTRAYLNAVIEWSSLRVDAVLSAKTSSELFCPILQYGTRLVDFYLDNRLVVTSNKEWPEFLNYAILCLDDLREAVKSYFGGQRNLDVSCLFKYIVYDNH